MRFRNQREAGFAAIGPTARIGLGLLAIALVVAFNQTSKPRSNVLGTKVQRCAVDGHLVARGPRTTRAQTATASVRNGGVGAILAPPEKIKPGPGPVRPPLMMTLGVRAGESRSLIATVLIRNRASCPVGIRPLEISARHGSTKVGRIGDVGSDFAVLDPGQSIEVSVEIPTTADGQWIIDATTTADVGVAVLIAVPV
jgi:hypothetical protein